MDPWSRGREVARDVLCPVPKLEKMSDFCHRSGIEVFSRLFSLHSRPNVFSQTPGRCPPHITGLRTNSVTLGWAGAPNERALCRFHDAIAVFSDRCLRRPRIADQCLSGVSRTSSGLLPGNYIPRALSRRVLKLPSTAKTPGSIHYYLPGRCNHASVQSSTFFGPLDRRETFNSGVFFFSKNRRWKDLQLAQSYGELRVPLLDHMKVTISVSFWIFFALLWTATSSQTQQLKKTNCRLFIL